MFQGRPLVGAHSMSDIKVKCQSKVKKPRVFKFANKEINVISRVQNFAKFVKFVKLTRFYIAKINTLKDNYWLGQLSHEPITYHCYILPSIPPENTRKSEVF